jgi:CHAT domain-containing protein
MYDWLIRWAEPDLANSEVQTLVFVLDGVLRNVPMAVLHDGNHYLIEKYSLALTPGLQLLDPKPLARKKFTALTAGLSEASQGFPPLPNVEIEVKQIEAKVSSQVLLNKSFTKPNFQANVNSSPFSVVHIATHGQFSSVAEDTFILTWDDRVNANELNSLLRTEPRQTRPIELLVLSACQTAVGDNRAALGLAGVAVRAGARSTVASLWLVSDDATASLMARFYEELVNNEVTKAEALRRAQLELLQNNKLSHPYFWAPFVLVGNWL